MSLTRRDFLQKTALSAAAMAVPAGVFAQGSDRIKVGLIGCGGRGTGAAWDACSAEQNVVIWSMGDLFKDRLDGSRKHLTDGLKERVQVTDDRCFTGFDAYKSVIASGVDVVLLCAPPGFRPMHFEAAVEARKHIFMEKPVATDGPGIRRVLAAADRSRVYNLNVVAGTQRRHDPAYRETLDRIHRGEIGDVTAVYGYWNQGGLWSVARKPEMSDMEWQIRNWLYFTWLAGDIIVEQHIHQVDIANWVMRGHPVKAISLAGREVRKDPQFGHVFDHFATEFEYENGVRFISMCRQIDGTVSRVAEHVVGSKGVANPGGSIRGENAWRFDKERVNPYVEEHRHLYDAILRGKPINEARQVAETTLTGIMGRMAGYTGQEVTWDQALNSTESLMPEKLEFGPVAIPPVAVPGQTKLV